MSSSADPPICELLAWERSQLENRRPAAADWIGAGCMSDGARRSRLELLRRLERELACEGRG